MTKESFFGFDEPPSGHERFDKLFEHKNVTIERIVSSGTQPPSKYLQDHDEWVMLVLGEAEMTVDGRPVTLKAGDTLHLPAGVEHEVLRTSVGAVWLAVHVR